MQQATFNLGGGKEVAARAGPDPRADGGRRMVLIERRCVTIRRRVQGMKMLLSLPVQSYLGVAIRREQRRDGAIYRISLAHRDPELCVTLKEARDLAAMRDAQRHFSAFFAMPALFAGGGVEPRGQEAGDGVKPPCAGTRTPAASATGRARRIVAKRHRERGSRAWPARTPTVFRGEREICSRE
ncbi:DUF6101 family protein [Methylocella sp.]|jgi:hypothetical protein|uniref:DUF6101 family protein n=1 Tax=Methylocella sp. TaxID=1978226 RepID=UPI003C1DEA91